jgi:tetratricopeptide (TPR) repeat protein
MARRSLICGWLLGAGVLLGTAGCDLFTRPAERVMRAEGLIDRGAYNEALVELNTAVQESPEDARTQLALAHVSLQLGRTDAATRALEVAAKSGADAARVAELRARVALQEDKFEEVLAATEPGKSAITDPARELLRMHALVAQKHFDEAMALARKLRADPATAGEASVVLAECLARFGYSDGALKLLDATVAAHPDAAEAWLARGRLLQIAGRIREAEESLTAALKNAGGRLTLIQHLNAAGALGDLQLARGDVAAARATYDAMLPLAPDSVAGLLLGARLTLADGKAAEAVKQLQALLARDASIDNVRMALASAQLAAGTFEQAAQQIAELVGKNPGASNLKLAADVVKRMRGLDAQKFEYSMSAAAVHLSLGQPHMARLAARRAAELSPDSPGPPAALAQLELRNGNAGEAERIATSMLARQPGDGAALALLAEAQRSQQKYVDAAATLQRLYAKTPSAPTALALARARREGKLGGEVEPLKAWSTSHPDDFVMRGAYADALRQAGDNRAAIAEFEGMVVKHPNSAPALNNLAWLYYLDKDPRAVATAKRAWQQAPHVPNIADTYGWLLVESGQLQEGLNILESAYQDGGLADPETRFHYASALARAGQRERAAADVAALLAEAPEFPSRKDAEVLANSLK